MAFNLDKINKKIEAEREREKAQSGFGPKVLWWKPKVGENRIRLTPAWTEEGENAGMPFREVYRHWGVVEGGFSDEGGASFTCPVRTPDGPGGTCEICDFVAALRASGNPADNETAKQLTAKRRMYSNIIDMKDPVYTEEDYEEWEENAREGDECHFNVGDTKVQVFSYGTTIYKLLLDFLQDGIDLGDFEDSVELKLVREGKGLNTKYRLRLNTKSKPFEFVGELYDLLYDLDNITPFPKEGDMAAALNGTVAQKASALPATSKAPSLPAASVVEEEDEDEYEYVYEDAEEEEVEPEPEPEPEPPKKKRKVRKKATKSRRSTSDSVEAVEAEMRDLLA